MKTAISIPDEIFEDAERLAKRLKSSRSELYSRALSEYVARHATDQVTEAMNEALASVDEPLDSFGTNAARRTLRRTEW
jgi:metal-responsive CopG/Arc/MetJ family transcriptional regulator